GRLNNMPLSQRRFLQALGVVAEAKISPVRAQDWDRETTVVRQMRERLEDVIGAFNMALDFRGFDDEQNERFRIQINADNLLPVASCFKEFVVPYYFLH